ncbi:MAG: CHASE2 domain-containing protein [Gammaproteobacteria bacterium]|nr:CHASE2 domain-containing protein [Gammaproteobacteria bacterium]MBU1603167.1 CHASE2 domain-containing protein [Gammaproteobacteria bacterium]MBU2432687.1 CHASE2 domain-containing protein [Gammaproteobacteria bacterium]MBU2451518.1 CHASE2 domain-containing protein [Gammaproteobacteria bacterium]
MRPFAGLLLAAIRAGRGRAFPLLVLVVGLLTLGEIERTPLLNVREALFDQYQRQMPRARTSEPVIVVGIDSQSLVKHGQWPWSRDLVARLVRKIQAGQPLALGIDIVFAERDRYSPEVLSARFPDLPPDALATLPDPDQELAAALNGHPTALAVIGLSTPLPGSTQPARPLPEFSPANDLEAHLPRYLGALASRPLIEKSAAGEGLINASPAKLQTSSERGVLRRVPTVATINQLPFLSLPLEMVRLALGGGGVVPESGEQGMTAIRIGDYRLPTQANGEVLLHFGRASSNYYLSAADVLAGVHPPEIFNARFVIIGFNSTGLQDRIVTPLGESLPGIDIHAQVIESLLDGHALQRPDWMALAEKSTLLLGGLLLIATIPVLRPRYAVLSFTALSLLLLVGGTLAFYAGQWLFDGASQVLLLAPVFILLLGNTLIAADSRRRKAESQLQRSREEAARVAGELDAARRIQMGLLPDPRKIFADETQFSIAALLEPAQAVGGDYYDCFLLDEQRLCLAIGDVSGKGVPASLFMAISKTLTGTLTRRQGDLGLAVREIEQELNRENAESLFVTAFIAVLDLASGDLEYVCAGHDAPMLEREGRLSQIDTSNRGGPPLCAAGDFPYLAERIRLQPGDRLCLFTDGVTEASNGAALFGLARLQAAIQAMTQSGLETTATALRDAVRQFEAGHPPADDLTLLLMQWHGPLSER